MNLHDLPPGHDSPVDWMLGYHRRIERALASLGTLCARLESYPVDATAGGCARSILECLGPGLVLHHADEERDLLPLLAARVACTADGERFRAARLRIEEEHRALALGWRAVGKPLRAIAEGVARPLAPAAIVGFRGAFAAHISFEESTLHALAGRHLGAADLESLARRMRGRRVIKTSRG